MTASTGTGLLGLLAGGCGGPTPFIGAADLQDYLPPFAVSDSSGQRPATAEADGNLWIPVSLARRLEGGVVFDVVNGQGSLVDRVQIPGGTALAGFGPGVAYLVSREGAGYLLARARIH